MNLEKMEDKIYPKRHMAKPTRVGVATQEGVIPVTREVNAPHQACLETRRVQGEGGRAMAT